MLDSINSSAKSSANFDIKKRLVLAGSSSFATAVFEPLFVHFNILALITQRDKPFGRSAKLKPPHTKEHLSQKLESVSAKIFQPERIDEALISDIRALKPEIILVVAYGKILPRAFLDIALCINIHGSILPQLRGASPLQQMILAQPKYFGITAIKMSEALDSGDMLGFAYIENNGQDINALSVALASCASRLVCDIIVHLDMIAPLKQIESNATYCGKITKANGLVSLESAKSVYYAYLAYCAWPHIFIKSEKGYSLKLFGIELVESSKAHTMGQILAIESSAIILGCKEGSIRVAQVQQEGKGKLDASIYLQGKRLKVGDILQ